MRTWSRVTARETGTIPFGMASEVDRDAMIEAKMAKSRDYLTVADVALASDMYDVAVSLAVSAAINTADAYCIFQIGRYSKAPNHNESAALLRSTGGANAANLARQLIGVLRYKNKAQYETSRCKRTEADATFLIAQRMYASVQEVVSGRK